MLTIHDFVMLANFIQVREDCGGAVKILDQDEYHPLRVVIDWHITAELLDEYNRWRGKTWTTEKPT